MAGINDYDYEDSFLEDYEVLGDYIPSQPIEDSEQEIEIMISDIVTPYRFYVQLKKQQIHLANLFESMQRFYDNSEKLRIPDEYIILNQICAAIFPDDQKWYRGRITKIFEYMVEIFYIDCGNKATIPLDNIRLLHNKFASLPAQAIQARHTGIVPKGQSFWDKQAIDKFKELLGKCHETGMIGIRKGIKQGPTGDIVCLVLIDTATNDLKNGIQIHQEMLRLGLAEWRAGNDSGYTSSPTNGKSKSKQDIQNATFEKEVPTKTCKPTTIEHELISPPTKPISVVAPTNNSVTMNSRETTNDHRRKSAHSAMSTTSGIKQINSSNAFEQQQQRHFPPKRSNRLQTMEATEPSSVSVSKWLQSLPNDNIESNNSNKASNLATEPENIPRSALYDEDRQLIREVSVANHTLHIFNLRKRPYVISAEISLLFPKWKKKDHLSKMIKLKKQSIQGVDISRMSDNHDWFFEQCLIEDVTGIETSDGDLVDSVTLYPMESLQSMLSLFGSSGGLSEGDISRLWKEIKEKCDSFNPNDEFWSSLA